MRMPFFIPVELSYCSSASTSQEILQILLQHTIDDLLAFFVAGCRDETWTAGEGGDVMHHLLQWLNQESYFRRIPENMAVEAASAVQAHFKTLQPFFHYDIVFIVENEKIPSSSLMFSAFSTVFRDVIRTQGSEKKEKNIYLDDISTSRFHQFAEFIYTGKIEYLWREEPEEIFQVIPDAARWGIEGLEAYASSIYQRYIERINVLDVLRLSHDERLPSLQRECCIFISQQNYGIEIESLSDATLFVSLSRYTDAADEILQQIHPLMSHLSLKGEGALDQRSVIFIQSLSTLQLFDVSHTTQIHSALPEAVPDAMELNVQGCSWLSDEIFFQLVARCPSLMKLNISDNEQLTFRSWAALSSIYNLGALHLSHCMISDDDLDLIAAGSENLAEIDLSSCKKISEIGLVKLAKQCPRLSSVNLSECSKISPTGIVEFAIYAKNIYNLSVSRCSCITDDSLVKIMSLMPYLKSIDIVGCSVSYSVIDKLKKQKPNLIIKGV